MGEEMVYPSDLAPLAPLRGEGPGEKGAIDSDTQNVIEAFQNTEIESFSSAL
jgi:hypothetical protein